MNSAQLIYRGKLRLSFNIPFLNTPFYLHTSHLNIYLPLLVALLSSTRGSARGSTYVSARGSTYASTCGSTHASTCGSTHAFTRVSTRAFARASAACVSPVPLLYKKGDA